MRQRLTEDEVEIKREKKRLGMGRKYALEKRQEMIRDDKKYKREEERRIKEHKQMKEESKN